MIKVFPRRTKWTPTDELAFTGDPGLFLPSPQPVRISVTFTWDIEEGLRLSDAWKQYYPDVQVGGPAFNNPGGEFIPGRFIKEGVTITSRGCIRNCPYCFVPKREGKIRELPIKEGWIVQDNNLLACSNIHIQKVFGMLKMLNKPVNFSGGLDPQLLKEWHIYEIERLKIEHLWFSCDYPGAEKHLHKVNDLTADFPDYKKRCYVLIGFNGETISQAESRLENVYEMGFLPFAQLYQGTIKRPWTPEWDQLQRKWCRPAAYKKKLDKKLTPSDRMSEQEYQV